MTTIARSGERSALTPSAATRSASMSRPESISSRMQTAGSTRALCELSLRFVAPPENPTLTPRLSMSCGMFRDFATSRTFFRKSGVEYSLSPRSEEHSLNSSHDIISYAVFCLKKMNRAWRWPKIEGLFDFEGQLSHKSNYD